MSSHNIVLRFIQLMPHHLLSRAIGRLARCKVIWIKNILIQCFCTAYAVDLSEAQQNNSHHYAHFNAFFTRALKASARPIHHNPQHILSPVDGFVSEIGNIENDTLLQAKGKTFTVQSLLGEYDNHKNLFSQGKFATLYLSPKDYHRIHMPLAGQLKSMRYIPGKLFPVKQSSVDHIPSLFARNERIVTLFSTPQGPVAIILVGALFVGSIDTVWSGTVTPPYGKHTLSLSYAQQGPHSVFLEQGTEMGRFNMGSTVILLLSKHMHATFDNILKPGDIVRLGQCLASIETENAKHRLAATSCLK